jgi:hypothetical protein
MKKLNIVLLSFALAFLPLYGCSSNTAQEEITDESKEDSMQPILAASISSAEKEEDGWNLSMDFYALAGSFSSDFDASSITLGSDFENAEDLQVESVDEKQAVITITLSDVDFDAENPLSGSIALEAGSLLDEDGNAAPSISYEDTFAYPDADRYASSGICSYIVDDNNYLVVKFQGDCSYAYCNSALKDALDPFYRWQDSNKYNGVIIDLQECSSLDNNIPYIFSVMATKRLSPEQVSIVLARAAIPESLLSSLQSNAWAGVYVKQNGASYDSSSKSASADFEQDIQNGAMQKTDLSNLAKIHSYY